MCMEDTVVSYALMPCGHYVCTSCYASMWAIVFDPVYEGVHEVQCPQCRVSTSHCDVQLSWPNLEGLPLMPLPHLDATIEALCEVARRVRHSAHPAACMVIMRAERGLDTVASNKIECSQFVESVEKAVPDEIECRTMATPEPSRTPAHRMTRPRASKRFAAKTAGHRARGTLAEKNLEWFRNPRDSEDNVRLKTFVLHESDILAGHVLGGSDHFASVTDVVIDHPLESDTVNCPLIRELYKLIYRRSRTALQPFNVITLHPCV